MAEGWRDFVAGDVLNAAQVDDYLMSQAVMRFADAATRNSTLTEVEGMVCFLKDSNTLTAYDGTSWWTVGKATKALTTGTTFVSQGATPTYTDTVNEYTIINGICDWWFKLDITSAGTGGTDFYINLPVAADNVTRLVGTGIVFDASIPTIDVGVWEVPSGSASRIQFLCDRSTGAYWGNSPSVALANGDSIRGHVRYAVETAA